MAVNGICAYVADGLRGLRVLDISNPTYPQEVGYFNTWGNARGVSLWRGYIYVADEEDGLYILKYFSGSPEAPKLTDPTRNATIFNHTPSLNWRVPRDLTGDLLHFKVEIATDSNFVNLITGVPLVSQNNSNGFWPRPPLRQNSGNCSYTLQTTLADGSYWWRVTGWDGTAYGLSSAVRKFTLGTRLVISAPQHNASGYLIDHKRPNPFSSNIMILYALPRAGQVQLKIFDINGQCICSLVDDYQPEGIHFINWAGKDSSDQPLPSGIYFSHLTAGNVKLNHKLLLISSK